MRNPTRTAVAATLAAASVVIAAPLASAGYDGHDRSGNVSSKVAGLTADGKLAIFKARSAESAMVVGTITGLAAGDALVGIDYRVQDGKLYGVGRAGGIYVIDTKTAKATKVGQLSVALTGTNFGVDFNPAANALRVVSNSGQNLRVSFATGVPAATTAVDGTLTYPMTPTAPATVATGVSAAAYTNNDLDIDTATTLFDLDTVLDQVVLQAPANAGLLSATGKLGVDAGAGAGFDIASKVGDDGATKSNTGLATLSVGGAYQLYSVDLLTGAVHSVGSFPAGVQVVDLAVPTKG